MHTDHRRRFLKALLLGIAGSFFFAFTFVLNRSMNLSGGHWLWSAALRYFFTLPILFLLCRNALAPVCASIRKAPAAWFLWSTVGFGLFYAPLSAASVFAESWFTASAWQFTIVAGILLTPLLGRKLPLKNLLLSLIILLGIGLMQLPKFHTFGLSGLLTASACLIVAAFSYPLGNRKMMGICGSELTTLQRVFGMTLCSMPFWLLCGIVAACKAGAPSGGQLLQSFLVALFSGVIATILFFRATDLVKSNPAQLAVVEATQAGEVIFTLLLGILLLHDSIPSPISLIGILLIVVGMIVNSLLC